ncbi:aspartate/glutamate racemase family protein [Bradyrhizobium sp. CIAT3101]|uniref:aspartate/glutamate racemase family protein n=1 Tax=Bradyrhizobium sp. CIAT3101 TaxID=439387 RepID=UPI0024B1A87B|nr:aspartate/glutamate racemase family protein [Bradyrhizobium sp. CIAT3101]WFU84969.1 aspartate/glutamate racemase family protein [Bradyrhizobium sp. CIAT3101]
MKPTTEGATRASIGIVAGSGPEAGIDLWSKVLARNQTLFGGDFRGDLDAPRVVVLSEPTLGLSMDLEENEEIVWHSLKQTIAAIAVQADAYTIACNTLNLFAPRILSLGLPGEFVSFQSALSAWVARHRVERIALLGAAPVTSLGPWSAYQSLQDIVAVETPSNAAELHNLILDVKRLGSRDPSLRPRLQTLVEGLKSDHVILACTELPLISDIETGKKLIDVTDLVAHELVDRSLAGRRGVPRPGSAVAGFQA